MGCAWTKCETPWEEHDGVMKIVHSERAEADKGCRCPILRVGDYCPIHGG